MILSVIGFSERLTQYKQRSPSTGSASTSWFKYIIHIERTQLLQYLKVIGVIRCSNRSFMGSQFIFSSSIKLVWALLFEFRQTRMYLFWRICNFGFSWSFRSGYQAEHVHLKKVVLERCKVVHKEVATKIYFFCTKT